MVEQRGRGWVCENNQEALNTKLVQVLEDPAVLQTVKMRLRESVMDNTLALEQFTKMIEG